MAHWQDFTPNDWQRIKHTWSEWWQGDLERAILFMESTRTLDEVQFADKNPHLTQFPLEYPVEEILNGIENELNHIDYLGDAYPKWHPNFGAGFLAALLGSRPEFNNGTTWFHPATQDLDGLEMRINPDNPWFLRLQEVYQAAIKRWAGKIEIGYTDIGGNLDILASLRESQKLLIELVEQPQKIHTWTHAITQNWLDLFHQIEGLFPPQQPGRTCWGPMWAPGSTYLLQCDISIMISPRMFNAYVMPDLEACCEEIDFPFYHLDGPGAVRHIDSILSIEKLRGVQWVPGAGAPPAEEWLPLLEKIRTAGKLCQVYVSVEGALKIARALGQKGFLFCIGDGRFPTHKEALTCLEEFSRL